MVIINNNWSPIPWGWGCGGHKCGGNWMNNMLKYNFMFHIMNNMQNMFKCYATPPQQQGGFYPGLYLGGGGSVPQQQTYEDYLKQQQDKQDFAELKSSYTGFKFTNIGGEYQARLTSNPSVRFSGSTPLELMEAMDEYIDEHPEDFKSKPAERKERVDNPDDVHEPDDGAGVAPVRQEGNAPAQSGRTGLPKIEGYKWTKYINLSESIKKQIEVGTSIEEALKAVGIENPTQEMINAMKIGNPNGLDTDEKVKDLNKLDILIKKQTATNNIPKDGQYVSRVVFSLNPGDGKDYASFTPPDGSDTITVSISTDNKDAATRRSELMTKLETEIKNEGWTNVTLWNKADTPTQPTIIQNFDKNKEYTVRMIYDATGENNKGVATATLPDGGFIKVNGKTANIALSELKIAITKDGWTKVNIDANKVKGIDNTVAHTDASNSTRPGLKTVNRGYYNPYYKTFQTYNSNADRLCLEFGSKNLVFKAAGFNKSNDTDAWFVIDGKEYQINSGGRDFDWEDLEISALSKTKTFSSLKALKGKHFDGDGPLKNVPITENNGVIGINTSEGFVSLNEIMDGRVKITEGPKMIRISYN